MRFIDWMRELEKTPWPSTISVTVKLPDGREMTKTSSWDKDHAEGSLVHPLLGGAAEKVLRYETGKLCVQACRSMAREAVGG